MNLNNKVYESQEIKVLINFKDEFFFSVAFYFFCSAMEIRLFGDFMPIH